MNISPSFLQFSQTPSNSSQESFFDDEPPSKTRRIEKAPSSLDAIYSLPLPSPHLETNSWFTSLPELTNPNPRERRPEQRLISYPPPSAAGNIKLHRQKHRLSPFNQAAYTVQQQAQLHWNNQSISLLIDKNMSQGEYHVIATIDNNVPPLIEGVDNNKLIVKIFRDFCLLSTRGRSALPDDSNGHVLKQYHQLKNADVPVAQLYNTTEVQNDCGFFLFKRIPHPFHYWGKEKQRLNELTPEQKEDLEQLKSIFTKIYSHNIDADLKPDNFRKDQNGSLVLVDIREKETGLEIDELIGDLLLDFAPKNSEIFQELDPRKGIAISTSSSS